MRPTKITVGDVTLIVGPSRLLWRPGIVVESASTFGLPMARQDVIRLRDAISRMLAAEKPTRKSKAHGE